MTNEERKLLRELVQENKKPQPKSWRRDYIAPKISDLAKKVMENEAERWDEAQKRGRNATKSQG